MRITLSRRPADAGLSSAAPGFGPAPVGNESEAPGFRRAMVGDEPEAPGLPSAMVDEQMATGRDVGPAAAR